MHDNATPHSANVTKALLDTFGWDVWEHPPYSPDLAPCDFHVFGPLKNKLAEQRYSTDEEVQAAVKEWCAGGGREFFKQGIQKLVSRYEKCKNLVGDYVEK